MFGGFKTATKTDSLFACIQSSADAIDPISILMPLLTGVILTTSLIAHITVLLHYRLAGTSYFRSTALTHRNYIAALLPALLC